MSFFEKFKVYFQLNKKIGIKTAKIVFRLYLAMNELPWFLKILIRKSSESPYQAAGMRTFKALLKPFIFFRILHSNPKNEIVGVYLHWCEISSLSYECIWQIGKAIV